MKSKRKIYVPLLVVLTMLSPCLRANNLRVDNVQLVGQDRESRQVRIVFDLAWDNSWHNALNHDAAWVFVKFRAPGSNDWQHAYLSPNQTDHQARGGVVEVGCSAVDEVDRGIGVFVYSEQTQTGTVSYAKTSLCWDYGASGYNWRMGEKIDVAVQGIEMVYVAEGPFFVGSGGTEENSLTDGGWDSGATLPLLIDSEAALRMAPEPGCLWGTESSAYNYGLIGPEGELPAAFPKGHAAFHCMKYEITQGQYADFLNLLTETQATKRYPVQYGINRFIITGSWPAFSAAEAPDRACGMIDWVDGAAYAQWAGLRPMTELEFEKACRGPAAPVPNEYVWGTTSIKNQTGHEGVDGSGTETALPADANVLAAGSLLKGPVRGGIYAMADSTRAQAGASYWGIMELGGNLWERAVTVGRLEGRSFTGRHGDGRLGANGNATVSDWPGYTSTGITGFAGVGWRGTHWNRSSTQARTSDRSMGTHANSLALPYGFRGVRTAPPAIP